ncbi:hypothetical protein A2533_04240 [Candidatus Falkowbacteria bacterium RIFOXYD2_FULL_35_9]|uniref:Uncharacterized protein n=1 Tax=Candidatus Falkowbacteria bacterium RIFOXYC2_FULL_36_12 TaxID=1798002 RepID=A0A1F5T326_9BACT|nr:MAG: hypothetical protein A2478_01455 [Candidatus Falkowbacteria bacterium RIFOXYC2_FULL_36_12]OGF33975.1 MAG: hypothetical protein A2223_01905 [Candidatus Falkowbacteria bacterium RIFOXYA2_FULL_35_8]OGF48525.1 MAG: hypothetical protein A2533_04240 [Candidatus Falkowbacteria bacterium RIFOXYD2_FULL_35_9]
MSYIKKTIVWYILLLWSLANWFYGYTLGTCHGGLGDSSTLLLIPFRLHCSVHWLLPIIFLIALIVTTIKFFRKNK